jgi:hypothetical protein
MTKSELKAAQQRYELGPVAMSRLLNVNYPAYSNWIAGRCPAPETIDRIIELVDRLEIYEPTCIHELSRK